MLLALYAAVASRVVTLRRTDRGATAVEYGLLAALIAIAIIVAVTALGTKISDTFSGLTTKIPTIT